MPEAPVEGFRLSPQQRRLWRLAQDGDPSDLRVQAAWLLEGPLDVERLAGAWRDVAGELEILRTGLRVLPSMTVPVQVIGGEPGALETGAPGSREVAAFFEEARSRPFDLAAGPLVRPTLVPLDEGRHLLLLDASAFGCDAVGLDRLVGRLADAYAGASPARTSEEEGELQYADLSEWMNELLEGEEGAEGRAFWARVADGLELALELPGSRAGGGSFRPGVVRAPLADGLRSAVRRAASGAGASEAGEEAFHVAAWATLLARWTGRDELVLGVRADGRAYDELADAIGPFERDLPLALDLDPKRPFTELLADVARDLEERRAWQDTWAPASGAHAAPPFAISFATDDRKGEHTADGVTFRIAERQDSASRSGLRLVLVHGARGDSLEVHLDAARFGERQVERLLRAHLALAAAAAAEPTRPLGRLPLCDEAERRRVVTEFNRTEAEPPTRETFPELFAAAAASHPDEPAILFGNATVTYAELDRRSNRLANHLRSLGVGLETRVGLFVERSPELLVGILGIQKAGAAYVPIDPGYPTERIAFLARDASLAAVVTQERLRERLPDTGASVVALDAGDARLDFASQDRPETGLSGKNAAYVIYTSGSTGTPKGVVVEHRNLVASTWARFQVYPHQPGCYLLLSSFAFDSSVVGIFWALACGGALALPEEGREREVHEIASLIERHGVTTMLALPSLYALLLEHADAARLATLDTVIVAGEASSGELVARHFAVLPKAILFNEYGPTEGTVWATAHPFEAERADGRVPIGRPIPNARAYVLDAALQPVPVGFPGELFLAGPGIARGYLDRPDVTAERFLPDPFRTGAGARMYRTGDLARWLPSGELEFLGRVDHQVKIRGYRVELGEIEEALLGHPGVAEAAVLAREDEPGDKRLVGYVVSRNGPPRSEDLQATLRTRLPEYMVPSALVFLPDLPRTPNGKVDRRALPAPERTREHLSAGYAAPRNEVEEILCEVWQDVLGVETVGIEDDFFALGGHSILAVRLVARMGETFQVEIGLRELFDAPTIGGLAAVLLADPARAARVEKTAELLIRLSGLSDEEVGDALEGKGA